MKMTHKNCDDQFKALDITTKRYIIAMAREMESAIKKHPVFAEDIVHGAAIVGEESGELLRAALNYHYEKGQYYEIHKEAIQTGATCLRFLIQHAEIPIPY